MKYEKMFGYSRTCCSFIHNTEKCPLTLTCPEKKETKETRDASERRHTDRPRSYKGVVINGNMVQQDKGREKWEYHGKRKGKMFEEDDSK